MGMSGVSRWRLSRTLAFRRRPKSWPFTRPRSTTTVSSSSTGGRSAIYGAERNDPGRDESGHDDSGHDDSGRDESGGRRQELEKENRELRRQLAEMEGTAGSRAAAIGGSHERASGEEPDE